ncbi:MAG: tyrosine-protein phosphatase [Pseudomonadota bacterium]|nr:tyrosine-protein phosphatase [Pseudomonadota bacterium]
MYEPCWFDPVIGLPNWRDLGGRTAGSKRVRRRQIFRSGAPDMPVPIEGLRRSGIKLQSCCDLRSAIERQRHPVIWPEVGGPQVLEFAVDVDIRVLDAASLAGLRSSSAVAAGALMRDIYRGLPTHCAPVLADLFVRLRDPAQRPLLVHCTAGKDRTGFVSAMLLYALGVDDASIRDDYLMTNRCLDRNRLDTRIAGLLQAMIGVVPDAVVLDALNAARADYLDVALDQVRHAHGSIEAYLRDAAALCEIGQSELRAQLLE